MKSKKLLPSYKRVLLVLSFFLFTLGGLQAALVEGCGSDLACKQKVRDLVNLKRTVTGVILGSCEEIKKSLDRARCYKYMTGEAAKYYLKKSDATDNEREAGNNYLLIYEFCTAESDTWGIKMSGCFQSQLDYYRLNGRIRSHLLSMEDAAKKFDSVASVNDDPIEYYDDPSVYDGGRSEHKSIQIPSVADERSVDAFGNTI